MFRAIRSTRRPATPLARLTRAVPAVANPRKRRLQVRTGASLAPVLATLVIAITAVIVRANVASIVARVDRDEEQAPDTGGEE
jgi:hypothetical protein